MPRLKTPCSLLLVAGLLSGCLIYVPVQDVQSPAPVASDSGEDESDGKFTSDGECVVVTDPIDFPQVLVLYGAEEEVPPFEFSILPNPGSGDAGLAIVDDSLTSRELSGKTFFWVGGLDGDPGTPVVVAYQANHADELLALPVDTLYDGEFLNMHTRIVKSGSMVDHVLVQLQRAGEAVKIQLRRF